MIDSGTNKPIRVLTDEVAGSYIRVSVKHLEEVDKLLSRHGVRYWVDHFAVSVDGKPAQTVIWLRRGSNPLEVQELLDTAA